METNKGLSSTVLFLIAVCILVLSGFMYYKANILFPLFSHEKINKNGDQGEVVDWKTYKDQTYDFEFEYPDDCFVEQINEPVFFYPPDTKTIERLMSLRLANCDTFVDVYTNPTGQSIEEWNEVFYSLHATGAGMSNLKPVSINGINGFKGLFGCCDEAHLATIFSKGNRIYLLSSQSNLSYNDPKNEIWLNSDVTKNADLFSKIISTFKINNYIELQDEVETPDTAVLPEYLVLPEPYISAVGVWPPTIQNSPTLYSCEPGSYEPVEIRETTIDGRVYCLRIESDATAGHIFRAYKYATESEEGTKIITFTLKYVNGCGPYSGTLEYEKCQEAQASFSPDQIINNLTQ